LYAFSLYFQVNLFTWTVTGKFSLNSNWAPFVSSQVSCLGKWPSQNYWFQLFFFFLSRKKIKERERDLWFYSIFILRSEIFYIVKKKISISHLEFLVFNANAVNIYMFSCIRPIPYIFWISFKTRKQIFDVKKMCFSMDFLSTKNYFNAFWILQNVCKTPKGVGQYFKKYKNLIFGEFIYYSPLMFG